MDSGTRTDVPKESSKVDEILQIAISDEEAQETILEKNAAKEQLFSIFSKREKRLISYAASFAAMFSGLSGFIYYPAMVPLAMDLSVSVQLINLTVTSYLIVAGIAPSFMGDIADQTGRRPVYIITFVLMIAANVGLALQKSYPALLVLRMLQSAGSSSTYSIAYGVIADIATVGERGSYVGIMIGSIYYSISRALGASLAVQSIEIYNLNYLGAGLQLGKLIDRNYKTMAKKHGHGVDLKRGDDISDFPIEKARLQWVYYLISISTGGTLGYGWSLCARTHIAVPLLMQFLTGLTMTSIFTICGTLLTDLNPQRSATAQAAYNLVRCIGAGGAVAALDAIENAIGLGWCFTIYSALLLGVIPLVFLFKAKGMK
ncbi:hypothetical protein V492_00979 [Pseudogymnoascus sp. VKM F-4246]|nr:hypothetical protein V492_00979 [Pseudogymnoascus sp. VKM F-4246]